MQPHELGDVFDLLLRKTQPFEHPGRDLRTHSVVAHERAVARGGRRLADVVEQGAQPHEEVRWRGGYGEERVTEYVMRVVAALLDPLAGSHLGQDDFEQSGLVEKLERQLGRSEER